MTVIIGSGAPPRDLPRRHRPLKATTCDLRTGPLNSGTTSADWRGVLEPDAALSERQHNGKTRFNLARHEHEE